MAAPVHRLFRRRSSPRRPAQARKKPTWRNTPRYPTTSAYSSTGPPAKPGCPSSSRPTTSHSIQCRSPIPIGSDPFPLCRAIGDWQGNSFIISWVWSLDGWQVGDRGVANVYECPGPKGPGREDWPGPGVALMTARPPGPRRIKFPRRPGVQSNRPEVRKQSRVGAWPSVPGVPTKMICPVRPSEVRNR
jgi:hypothetical protein